jgi:hypothetical protein
MIRAEPAVDCKLPWLQRLEEHAMSASRAEPVIDARRAGKDRGKAVIALFTSYLAIMWYASSRTAIRW